MYVGFSLSTCICTCLYFDTSTCTLLALADTHVCYEFLNVAQITLLSCLKAPQTAAVNWQKDLEHLGLRANVETTFDIMTANTANYGRCYGTVW